MAGTAPVKEHFRSMLMQLLIFPQALKTKAKRDQQYLTIVKEFKADRTRHEEYVRRLVKFDECMIFPRKALMKALKSDSD